MNQIALHRLLIDLKWVHPNRTGSQRVQKRHATADDRFRLFPTTSEELGTYVDWSVVARSLLCLTPKARRLDRSQQPLVS
jgi:hypothetical protein